MDLARERSSSSLRGGAGRPDREGFTLACAPARSVPRVASPASRGSAGSNANTQTASAPGPLRGVPADEAYAVPSLDVADCAAQTREPGFIGLGQSERQGEPARFRPRRARAGECVANREGPEREAVGARRNGAKRHLVDYPSPRRNIEDRGVVANAERDAVARLARGGEEAFDEFEFVRHGGAPLCPAHAPNRLQPSIALGSPGPFLAEVRRSAVLRIRGRLLSQRATISHEINGLNRALVPPCVPERRAFTAGRRAQARGVAAR